LAQLESLSVLRAPDPPSRAAPLTDLDLLLTDAFLVYASHLLSGRINPETIDPEWRANRRGVDLVPVLEQALAGGHGSVRATLEGLMPLQEGYRRLRAALERYRAVERGGGWPAVPPGAGLGPGARDARVVALRERLRLAGDLEDATPAMPDSFDAMLGAAVRRFQGRHGLEPTGAVDAATLRELNVNPHLRVQQVELNLERWRWLPQDLGRRHILVNIAGFELDLVEDGRTVLDMRVLVGRPYRRTPVFSDTMRYLVLSPYWNVPRNIAVQDKLPLIKRDPGYLAKQQMRVFSGDGGAATELDPATIDWSQVTPATFAYRLRQDPGPLNALGQVKFMFPNAYNVYLHDTPSRELFARASRDFSSGCIRLEKPVELALALLRDDPTWTRARVDSVIARRAERTIVLAAPVPVHLLFWTAWAGPDGTIQFRRDLYGRDARLERALAAGPPA
jgi:murein L,D-transpeptidase YcbB/YkuD